MASANGVSAALNRAPYPVHDYYMLATRVATALVLAPLVVAGLLFLPTAAVVVIFAALMLLGAWEWGALLGWTHVARAGYVLLCGAVIVALSYASPLAGGFWIVSALIGVACLWWLAAVYWLLRFPRGWDASIGRPGVGAALGLVVLCAPLAAIGYVHESDQGAGLLLLLFVLVWGADTGAYFTGRALGRHKLAPRISPGKTREGAVGGVVTALLAAAAGGWLMGYDSDRLAAFVILGGWVATVSIVGDLTLSMFKRHAGLKDSGTLFPGHGGVLDRLDSLIAAAPWFMAGLHWLPAGG